MENSRCHNESIEAALAELRELSSEPHLGRVFVTRKFCYSTEDVGAFEVWNIEGYLFGDGLFVGTTLDEAMEKVRQFHASLDKDKGDAK
jgi:hypothetical protein